MKRAITIRRIRHATAPARQRENKRIATLMALGRETGVRVRLSPKKGERHV